MRAELENCFWKLEFRDSRPPRFREGGEWGAGRELGLRPGWFGLLAQAPGSGPHPITTPLLPHYHTITTPLPFHYYYITIPLPPHDHLITIRLPHYHLTITL